jgi:hypothetical protein
MTRKSGSKNRPGHKAGGKRKNAGRRRKNKAVVPQSDQNGPSLTTPSSENASTQVEIHVQTSSPVETRNHIDRPLHSLGGHTSGSDNNQNNIAATTLNPPSTATAMMATTTTINSTADDLTAENSPIEQNTDDEEGYSNEESDETNSEDEANGNDDNSDEDDCSNSFWKSEGPIQSYAKQKFEQIQNPEARKKIFSLGQIWLRAPEAVLTMKSTNPDHFFRPDIFLWFPDEYPNGCQITCPFCDAIEVRPNGWAKNPGRKVYSLNRFFILVSQRFICRNCSKTFMGHDPKVVQKLPAYLQYLFPAILTKRGGLCVKLLSLIKSLAANGLGFSNVHDVIDELQHLEFDISQIKYYDLCTKKIGEKQTSVEKGIHRYYSASNESHLREAVPQKFGSFSNVKGYAGKSPSTNYIQKLFIDHHKSIREWMDSKISDVKSEVLKIDHTFSLPEYIGLAGGEKLFHALFTAMNEYGEIRLQFLAPTKGFTQLDGVFKRFQETCANRSYNLPKIIYTDNCCGDRKWISNAALGVVVENEKNLLQFKIPEEINPLVVSNISVFEDICEVLLEDNVELLAFDAEWNYSEHNGPERLAILQITDGKSIWIVQMHKIKKIPDSFLHILFDVKIKKVGRMVNSDITKLIRDWKSSDYAKEVKNQIKGVVDIAAFAKLKGVTEDARLSLEKLTEIVLESSLDKSLRHSNWEMNELTHDLINYAASDVLSSYQIYQKLVQKKSKERLKACPQSGTKVSIMCMTGIDTVVATGTVISKEDANYRGKHKLTKNRAFVRVDTIIAESAIIGVEKIALSQIQCLPYTTLFNLWQLSTEILPEERSSSSCSASNLSQISIPQLFCNDDDQTEIENTNNHSTSSECIDMIVSDGVDSASNLNTIFQEGESAINVNRSEIGNEESDEENTIQQTVLQDVFHLMRRMHIKAHPMRSAFFKCLREAMFLLDKNDYENVKSILKDSFHYNLDLWSSFCQSRIRRYIPAPKVLYARVKKVFDHFNDLIREMKMTQNAKKILMHIEKGCISDPKGIQLYKIERKDSNGLPIYSCSRGTNSVESLHQKLVRQFACYHASAELADSLLAELRHRHNSRAGVRHRGYFDCHHYDQYLIEHIQMLTIELYGQPTIKNWPSSSNWTSSKEKFGIIPMFGENQSPHPNLKGQYKFLAEKMGTKLPFVPIHGKDEISLFKKCLKEGSSDSKIVEIFEKNADPSKNIYPKLIEHITLFRKKSKKVRESENLLNEERVRNLIVNMRMDYVQLQQPMNSSERTIEQKTSEPSNTESLSNQNSNVEQMSTEDANILRNNAQQISSDYTNSSTYVRLLIPPMASAIPNHLMSSNFAPASVISQNNKRKLDELSSKKDRNRRTCQAYREDSTGNIFICGRTADNCKGSTRAGVCTFANVKETHYNVKVNERPRSKPKKPNNNLSHSNDPHEQDN